MPNQDQPNETTEEVVEAAAEEVVDTPEADAEAAAPEAAEATEQTSENINLEDYWQQRYSAPQASGSQNLAVEVSKELAQLPADEQGNVDANAAAQWFASKLAEVSTSARAQAEQSASSTVMSMLSEQAQIQELLKQYPEVQKDKEYIESVFDLRDAAALRGQRLTLNEAAGRLDRFRQEGSKQGQKQATQQRTIQAAAHLETSAIKGDSSRGETQRLASAAFQGSGPESTEARRELLRRHVQKQIEEGRIQLPGA